MHCGCLNRAMPIGACVHRRSFEARRKEAEAKGDRPDMTVGAETWAWLSQPVMRRPVQKPRRTVRRLLMT